MTTIAALAFAVIVPVLPASAVPNYAGECKGGEIAQDGRLVKAEGDDAFQWWLAGPAPWRAIGFVQDDGSLWLTTTDLTTGATTYGVYFLRPDGSIGGVRGNAGDCWPDECGWLAGDVTHHVLRD